MRDVPLLSRATVSSLDFPSLLTSAGKTQSVPSAPAQPSSQPSSQPNAPTTETTAFLGAMPGLSLVARDWADYRLVAGSKVVATDQYRASRANRFLLARLHIDHGRFTPYVQVGVGQWRVDTDILPLLPRDIEPAAQMGLGSELRLGKTTRLAAEVDWTTLYRESHEPQMIAPTVLVAGHLALRTSF